MATFVELNKQNKNYSNLFPTCHVFLFFFFAHSHFTQIKDKKSQT